MDKDNKQKYVLFEGTCREDSYGECCFEIIGPLRQVDVLELNFEEKMILSDGIKVYNDNKEKIFYLYKVVERPTVEQLFEIGKNFRVQRQKEIEKAEQRRLQKIKKKELQQKQKSQKLKEMKLEEAKRLLEEAGHKVD